MASLHIENVPDDLYERLRERAIVENRSLDSEVVALLEHAIAESEHSSGGSDAERLTEIFRRADERAARYGPFPDSVADIRAMRAEREQRKWQ
jgi:plasmid stability protein